MKNKKIVIFVALIIIAIICIIILIKGVNPSSEKNESNIIYADQVIDEIPNEPNKNEEIVCEDIKINLKGNNIFEKIQDNFYAIYAENDGLMRIEVYKTNQSIEEFYNDDIILEQANAININPNHEYYLNVDENGNENSIKPEQVKNQIANNQFEGIVRENFKIDSKEEIEINGIKGIKYMMSYTEDGRKMEKTIYLLRVGGQTYKFNIITQNEAFEEIINSIKNK